MPEQGGGALMRSVAAHWVCWPWGFHGGTGQVQPPPVFGQGHPAPVTKKFEVAATCSGLGDSQAKQAVNLGWLLLVLGLQVMRPAVACLRGFRKLCSMS